MTKLGIGSYTFAWAVGIPGHLPEPRMDAFALLDEAARLGLSVVQICDNMPFADLPDAEIDRFASAAAEAGVTVELGARGLDPANLLRHLALVRKFGGTFLRLVIDQGDDQPTPDETVARLATILPAFADAGVRVAIENHDRFPALTLAALVESLGTDRAAITLDTVNSFGAAEGPRVVVPQLAPYTACLHVKDFPIRRPHHQLGFLVEGCAAGDGQLDIPWLLESVAALSPHPCNAILETWVTPSDSLDETIARERAWADRGTAFLRDLIPH
ncbi:sugar phosphate isomerase/epimerase [soil metagenome]